MKKRTLSLLLCLAMALSLLPTAALALSRRYITSVSLEVTVPEDGATPAYTATPTGLEDRYQVSPSTGGGFSNGIYWYDETANRMMSASAAYIGGHEYSVHIKLEKTGDAEFDADLKAKINGADAKVEKYSDSVVVSASIACLAESIDSAALSVTVPAPGAAPVFTAKVADGAHYTAEEAKWYQVDAQNLSSIQKTLGSSDRFEAGKSYVVSVVLKPNEGYAFSGSVKESTVTVNGAAATFVDARTTQVTVQHVFPLPKAGGDLSSVALTVTAPEAGKAPVFLAAFSPDSLTFVNRQMGSNEYCSNGVSWVDANTHTYLKPGDTFQAGHSYQVSAGWLKPAAGEALTADGSGAVNAKATVNGSAAELTGSPTSFIVSYTFPALAASAAQEHNPSGIRVVNPPDKTIYYVGETFETKGMVVMVDYADGTKSAVVTNYTLLPQKVDANTKAVSVVYTENGQTVSTTQPITVRTGRANPFTDVKESDYFFDAVQWAYYAEPQVTNGIGDKKFGPDNTVTRGQAMTFLWRAAGCPEPKSTQNKFSDIKASDYWYKAILWASEKGIANGTGDGQYSPNMTCSRAHIVTFLYRMAGSPGAAPNPNNAWYTDAMDWASGARLLAAGADIRDPMENCPRCDVVAYLYQQLGKAQ